MLNMLEQPQQIIHNSSAGPKSHHAGKVTSSPWHGGDTESHISSGKSHQGRRITMAEPLSSIIRDLVQSSRSIAHSDDFEGHKLIQTNSRQLFLLNLNILY